jgi:putative ABC transport system permease protein
MVYLPLHARSDVAMLNYYMELRVDGDPASFVATTRSAIGRAEPALLGNDISTIQTRLARQTARERVVAYLAWSFAALTLLLASLGIYGVLAYDVARRTKEIGVRVALGARRWEITQTILSETLGVAGTGVVLGLFVAAVLARYLQSLLYEVSAMSLSAFAIVPVVLAVVAAAAAYLPIRRVMKVDPMTALRYE